MKLSFSLASKPSSNPKKQQPAFSGDESKPAADKEYLTEFDPSKAPASSTKPTPIIPPKSNEWQPTKRMKNLHNLPLQSNSSDQPLQFELDNGSGSSVDPDGPISYGLNLRNPQNPNPNPSPGVDPTLHRLKEDLKRLPDHNGMDEFTDMPVDGFGAALLKGYGWVEGRGIGRNAKEDVKIVELKKWTAKEGIGFVSEAPPSRKDRELRVGKEVRVVRGKEMGVKGRVLDVSRHGDFVVLKLAGGNDEVKLEARDVAELGSVEEERCLKKLKELKVNEEESVVDDGVRKPPSGSRKKESKRSRDERVDDGVSWLATHIRVRIISKDLKGGRLYLRKGEVVDVVGPMCCDICMDETRELIQGVDQDLLETAIPKRGGPVLVLYGRHKGVYGQLVERDSEKATGVVQDSDTKELLKVRLEQIAEYIGDPTFIDY